MSRGLRGIELLTVVIQRDFALVAALVAIPGESFIQHQLDLGAQSLIAKAILPGLAYYGQGASFVAYTPAELM